MNFKKNESVQSSANNSRRRKKKNKKLNRILAAVLLVMVCTMAICFITFIGYVLFYLDTDIDTLSDKMNMNLTSIVYATDPSTGKTIEVEHLYAAQHRIWADGEQIPQNMKNAFVAIEDERFLKHNGVDWKRTIGATINYALQTGKSYGGSTITQQLVKNLTGEDQVRPDRKIKEILRAIQLEKKYTKEEILEMYLNTIFLGNGLNGVQTAANIYFGKDISELSLAECASIAGITKYPTKYNPFLNPDANKLRQEIVLNKMRDLGYITDEECNEAKAEKLVFQKEEALEQQKSKQSYFVDALMEDIITDLMAQNGYTRQIATNMVYSGGLQIYATIDPKIQKAMEEVFTNPSSFPTLRGKTQPEASMVIMDPYTGEMKGIIGGRGVKTQDRGLNYATQTYRQPGSTIKPISVYAPAIENDMITYGSAFDDTPVKNGWPKNYYSGYRGMMSVEKALELSVNTVAVKVLEKVGYEKSADFLANNLGISTIVKKEVIGGEVKSDLSASPLALGGLTKGVSVKELNAAYAPFVNSGHYVEPHTYTKVTDSNGKVLLEKRPETRIAMQESTAFIMSKLLQNVVAQGTGTGARLRSGIPTAGKTGTTDSNYDRWFVGYSPYYVGTVWFGYAENKSILGTTYNPALRAWKLVMDKVHAGYKYKNFGSAPQDVVAAQYCSMSGNIPTEWCSADVRGSTVRTGWFKKSNMPSKSCSVHVPAEICSESGKIATEFCPRASIAIKGLMDLPNRTYSGAGDVSATVQGAKSCDLHTTKIITPEKPVKPEKPDEEPGNNPPEDDETGDNSEERLE